MRAGRSASKSRAASIRECPAEVEIGLVGAGDVEGAVVKSGGLGFEGLNLELVDSTGAVIAAARSDYDGYFLFERVPYGSYRVRLAEASAEAARVPRGLSGEVSVTDEKPVVRLGLIHIEPPPQIASADSRPRRLSPSLAVATQVQQREERGPGCGGASKQAFPRKAWIR